LLSGWAATLAGPWNRLLSLPDGFQAALFQNYFEFFLENFKRKFPAHDFRTTLPQFRAEQFIRKQNGQSFDQPFGVPGRNEYPIHAIFDYIGGSSAICAHQRLAKCHRFKKD
jgi:hypothetical protein